MLSGIHVRLPKAALSRLEALAAVTQISRSYLIGLIVAEWLGNPGAECQAKNKAEQLVAEHGVARMRKSRTRS
jgi:hypothetical protein